jgi:hypothetical protein
VRLTLAPARITALELGEWRNGSAADSGSEG